MEQEMKDTLDEFEADEHSWNFCGCWVKKKTFVQALSTLFLVGGTSGYIIYIYIIIN